MSAADSLTDALREIADARVALAKGDMTLAILALVQANRYHALALALNAMTNAGGLTGPVPPLANAGEVALALNTLREEVTKAATPRRAPIADVVTIIAEGLAPILCELATPGADPDAVVAARARNTAAIVLATFTVHAQ